MYFFGAFENLLWDSLKDTHGPIWNSALMQGILPHAYKTIPSLLFGAHEFTTPPSLSDLASFCVDICGESLFPHLMSGLNAEPILFPTRNSYQYFKPWLCDHLIMTFAYCFCHDNLEHISIGKASNKLLKANPELVSFTTESKTASNNFKQEFVRKYRDFLNQITSTECNDAKTVADIALNSVECKAALREEMNSLKNRLQSDKIPVPCVWFLLFLVNNRIQFRNLLTDNYPLDKMAEFLPKSGMTSLLATCNTLTQSGNQADTSDEGQMSKLHMWKDEGAFFVEIPELANATRYSIPTLNTPIKGLPKESYAISPLLQTLFNNFLIEKYLHIYSLTEAMEGLQSFNVLDWSTRERTNILLPVFDLHATLVQRAYIELLLNPSISIFSSSLIHNHIQYLNNSVLPVMEELFIWSVKATYPDTLSVFPLIEKTLISEEGNQFYKRMTLFRKGNFPQSNEVDNKCVIDPYNLPGYKYEINTLQKRLIQGAFIDPLFSAYGRL